MGKAEQLLNSNFKDNIKIPSKITGKKDYFKLLIDEVFFNIDGSIVEDCFTNFPKEKNLAHQLNFEKNRTYKILTDEGEKPINTGCTNIFRNCSPKRLFIQEEYNEIQIYKFNKIQIYKFNEKQIKPIMFVSSKTSIEQKFLNLENKCKIFIDTINSLKNDKGEFINKNGVQFPNRDIDYYCQTCSIKNKNKKKKLPLIQKEIETKFFGDPEIAKKTNVLNFKIPLIPVFDVSTKEEETNWEYTEIKTIEGNPHGLRYIGERNIKMKIGDNETSYEEAIGLEVGDILTHIGYKCVGNLGDETKDITKIFSKWMEKNLQKEWLQEYRRTITIYRENYEASITNMSTFENAVKSYNPVFFLSHENLDDEEWDDYTQTDMNIYDNNFINKNGGVYDNSETEFMLRHVTHDIMKTTNDKEEEKKGIRAKIKKNIGKKIGKLSGKIGKNISDIYRRKKQKKREIEEKEKEIEEEKKTIPWFEHYDWSETINSKISSSNTNTYEDGGKSLPILLPQSATPDINEINEINEITHRFRRGEPRGARMENIKNKIIDIKNLFHGEENEKGEKFEGLHTSHNEILAIIKNIEVVSDIIIQKTFQKFKPDIKNLLINLNKIVLEKAEREDIKKVGESYSNIYNTIETIMKDFEKNIGGATEKYQEALWKSRQKKDSSEWKDKQEDNIMILQNFKKFYNRVKNFTKNHNNFNYQWNKKNSITEIEKVKIFLKKCGHEIYGDTIIKTEDQKKYESSSFYKLFKKIWHGMLKVKKNLNARKYQLESTLADTFPLGKKKSFEYALKDMFFDYQCILMPLDILEQVIPYCNNSFGPNHEQKVDLFNFNKIDKDESALVIKNYNMISEMSIQKFKKKIGDDGNVLKKYFNLKEACESTFKRRGIGSGRVSTHLRKNLLKDVFPEKFLKMHIKAWSTYYHDSNVQKINKIDIKKMKDNSDKEKNRKINKIKDEINKLRDEINKSEDESEGEKTIKSEKELLDKEKYFFDYLNKKYDEKINRNKKKMDNIKEKQVYFYNWERKITMYFSDDFICENKDNQQKFQKMLENYEKKINIRISDCNYIYKMQGRSLMDNTSRSLTYDANVVHQYDMKNDRSDLTLKNAMKIAMGNTIRMGGKLKFGINGYDTDSREETKI